MAPDVALQTMMQDSFVREHGNNTYRPRSKTEIKKALLEDEIRLLRRQMELGVESEKSFSSEVAVRLSMMLDDKINEYNAFMKHYRK